MSQVNILAHYQDVIVMDGPKYKPAGGKADSMGEEKESEGRGKRHERSEHYPRISSLQLCVVIGKPWIPRHILQFGGVELTDLCFLHITQIIGNHIPNRTTW